MWVPFEADGFAEFVKDATVHSRHVNRTVYAHSEGYSVIRHTNGEAFIYETDFSTAREAVEVARDF